MVINLNILFIKSIEYHLYIPRENILFFIFIHIDTYHIRALIEFVWFYLPYGS